MATEEMTLQSQRQFEIIYVLLNQGQCTARQLAERFEVSVRTIYRDLEALSLAGVPVYAEKGRFGGIRLMDGYVLNKALFTQDERLELLSALQVMRAARTPVTEQAHQKLSSFLSENTAPWVEIEFQSWGIEQAAALATMKHCIIHRKEMSFSYWGREGGGHARRTVQPLLLSFQERAWYLKAFCLMRKDYRMFKVNRMLHLENTGVSFDRDYQAEAFYAQREKEPDPVVPIRLWIDGSMRYRVMDEFAKECVEENPDGSFTIEVGYTEDEWVYGFLLSFGEYIRVLEPTYLRDLLVKRHLMAAKKNAPGEI